MDACAATTLTTGSYGEYGARVRPGPTDSSRMEGRVPRAWSATKHPEFGIAKVGKSVRDTTRRSMVYYKEVRRVTTRTQPAPIHRDEALGEGPTPPDHARHLQPRGPFAFASNDLGARAVGSQAVQRHSKFGPRRAIFVIEDRRQKTGPGPRRGPSHVGPGDSARTHGSHAPRQPRSYRHGEGNAPDESSSSWGLSPRASSNAAARAAVACSPITPNWTPYDNRPPPDSTFEAAQTTRSGPTAHERSRALGT